VALGHHIDVGVVEVAVGLAVVERELMAAPQSLLVARRPGCGTEGARRRTKAGRRHLHRLAVQVEDVVLHLDAVVRQADDALDVVDVRVVRQGEDDDVAAVGRLLKTVSRPSQTFGRSALRLKAYGRFRPIADMRFALNSRGDARSEHARPRARG
jgi:hypothetical protein